MALQKPTSKYGFDFPNAYYKIESETYTEGRIDNGTKYYICNLTVKCYSDNTKTTVLEDGVALGAMRQDFTESEKNLSAHYEWLKTLNMFEGAIDA